MTEIEFRAIPAFVVSSDIEKQVMTVWCGKQLPSPLGPVPASPPASYIELDFTKTLSKVAAGTLPQLDDPSTAGGRTGIWPVPMNELPTPGTEKPAGGVVYYAYGYTSFPTFHDCVRPEAGGWTIPSTDSPYQYQLYARIADDHSITRFHGFKARIVEAASPGSSVVKVDIYKADSDETKPAAWPKVQVNLANANLCHQAHTKLSSSSRVGDVGPIFFAGGSSAVLGITLEVPKLPIGYRKRTW